MNTCHMCQTDTNLRSLPYNIRDIGMRVSLLGPKVIHTDTINETKYQNAILYLISRISDHKLHGTERLARLLYYVDFDRYEYKESMEPVTGDIYMHNPNGPVPCMMGTVLEHMQESGQLSREGASELEQTRNPTDVYLIDREPNPRVFDKYDRYILNMVFEKYGTASEEDLNRQSCSEAPWLGTAANEEIPYELSFYRGTFN